MVEKEQYLNVGGIDVDDKVLQGIIDFLSSGQIVLTSVNTDDTRSVTFALADPLNVNVTSPDPLPVINEDADGDVQAISTQGSAAVEIYDGAKGPAEIDGESNAQVGIDFAHHEGHEGYSFRAEAHDISMANADVFVLAFKTPAGTKLAHLLTHFSTLAGGHVDVLEGPTWDTSSGSQNPIFNKKRSGSMNSSMLLEDTGGSFVASDNMVLNPTSLAGGTILPPVYAFGKKDDAPPVREVEEYPLWPDKTYAVRFTADGANNTGQVILDWYEHTTSN